MSVCTQKDKFVCLWNHSKCFTLQTLEGFIIPTPTRLLFEQLVIHSDLSNCFCYFMIQHMKCMFIPESAGHLDPVSAKYGQFNSIELA